MRPRAAVRRKGMREQQGNAHQEVTTQLSISLAKVGKGALTLPKRYGLDSLSKSYRERVEMRLQTI